MDPTDVKEGAGSMSKVKLVLGAAGLFLFIVGVKRSFRASDEDPGRESAAEESAAETRRASGRSRSASDRERPIQRS